MFFPIETRLHRSIGSQATPQNLDPTSMRAKWGANDYEYSPSLGLPMFFISKLVLGLGSSSRWPVFFSGSPQRPVSWVVQGLLRLHGCLHCLCHLRWKAIFGWKWQEHRWRWYLWVSYYGYKIDIKYGDNMWQYILQPQKYMPRYIYIYMNRS